MTAEAIGKKPILSKENLYETAKLAMSGLGPAIRSALFYTFVGLVFGFFFLVAWKALDFSASLIRPKQELIADLFLSIGFVLEHLGIGLIVAAISVFFYEWGAHIKHALDLSARLVQSIGQIEETTTLLERSDQLTEDLKQTKLLVESLKLTERLYTEINKSTKLNLGACLNSSIGGPIKDRPEYLNNAVQSCENLVTAIMKLRLDNLWANNKYIEFISKEIDEFVGHNARAFSDLQPNRGAQEFKVPPTAAQMAVEILALQMEVLEERDRYDVISDLSSWSDVKLDRLFDSTMQAVTECDVEVNRVFNVLPYLWRGYDRDLPTDVKDILIKHLNASDCWRGKKGTGCYRIKILWPEKHAKLKTDNRVKNINIPGLLFGLFVHAGQCIKFSVTKPDLSDMQMSRQRNDNDDIKIFEAIWDAAEDFPQGASVEDRVNRVVLALTEQRERKS